MTFAMLPSLYPTRRSPPATACSTLMRWTAKAESASRAGQVLVGAVIGAPFTRAVRRVVATSWSSVVCMGVLVGSVGSDGVDGAVAEAETGVIVAEPDGAGAVELF